MNNILISQTRRLGLCIRHPRWQIVQVWIRLCPDVEFTFGSDSAYSLVSNQIAFFSVIRQ